VAQGIRAAVEQLQTSSSSQPIIPFNQSKNTSGLPYLCDRSPQKEKLRGAWLAHRCLRPRRPLLCVIHGDEYECHDKFIERLKAEWLPELLQLKGPVEECAWSEPPQPHYASNSFWLSFGEKVLTPAPESAEDCRERWRRELATSTNPLFVNLG
jgi:hypothetical protein